MLFSRYLGRRHLSKLPLHPLKDKARHHGMAARLSLTTVIALPQARRVPTHS
jgi:hypothetical protein